jgi:hypothetical protein
VFHCICIVSYIYLLGVYELYCIFRPNKNAGNAPGVQRGGVRNNQKKKNTNALPGVSKNGGGRVTKQGGRQNNTGGKLVFKGNANKPNLINPKKGVVVDARNKLLANNRLKITDARDRLAAMAKKTDLRQKLASKKPELSRKPTGLNTRPNQGIKKLIREVGRSPLTRTTIGRTVENELARLNVGPVASHYMPPRYDLLPPPNFYPYHQQPPSYDLVS